MSTTTTTVAILGVGLAGVVFGVVNHSRSGRLEKELGSLKATVAQKAEAPEREANPEIALLRDRLSDLERRLARSRDVSPGVAQAAPVAAPTEKPAQAAAEPAAADGGPAGKKRPDDVAAREAMLQSRKEKASEVVSSRWRKWGEENGLNESQKAQLAKLQADAAEKREELRAKRQDRSLDQAAARAENARLTEEIRSRAKELLNEDQFAKFEQEKGAERGSSWRRAKAALGQGGKQGKRVAPLQE